jgi:hypothetical protein
MGTIIGRILTNLRSGPAVFLATAGPGFYLNLWSVVGDPGRRMEICGLCQKLCAKCAVIVTTACDDVGLAASPGCAWTS